MSTIQEQWFPEVSRLENYRMEFAKDCVSEPKRKRNQRGWFSPPSGEDASEEDTVTDLKTLKKRFASDHLEEAYRGFLKDCGGNVGQHMSMQYQAGIAFVNERAFRARHTTVPRMFAHSMISKFSISAGREEDLLRSTAMGFISDARESLKDKKE